MFSPRKNTQGNTSIKHEFLRIIWFFWKNYLGYKNWIFPWKTIWTYICYWGWGTFSWGLFFPMSFFLKLSKKYTRKKPWKNSEESQKKYQPTRTLEKLCKTQAVADLHLNWQSCHVIQYSKFCHNKHSKRFEVSKNKFQRNDGQVGSRISVKIIPTVWNVEQFDIGQLGCGTSLVQHFGSLIF